MIREVVFLPPALDEIGEAATWYEDKRAGLGDDFILEVRRAVERVQQSPELYRIIRQRTRMRRVLAIRFPYKIYFVLKGDTVVIHAVMHNARRDWNLRKH